MQTQIQIPVKTVCTALESLDCLNYSDKSNCPIKVLVLNTRDSLTDRKIAACNSDCHLIVLCPHKNGLGTKAYFTGCKKVRDALDTVFGPEDLRPIHQPASAGEFGLAGVVHRSLRPIGQEEADPRKAFQIFNAYHGKSDDNLVIEVNEEGMLV